MTTPTRLTLDVEAVAHGGICVARHEGRVVFVRHALPGERVVAEVTEEFEGRRFLRADAVEVLVASPDRVTPPCELARPGGCGGCDWQHVSPEGQRRLKAAVVREQLQRLGGIDREVVVEEVGGGALGWRTRVQFAVDPDGVVGLRRSRSKDVEPVAECLIAHPLVNEVGASRREWPGTSAVEVIASVGFGDRAVIVTPSTRGAELRVPPLDVDTAVLSSNDKGKVTPVRGRPGVRERALGREWRVSSSGFWQVHPQAPELLSAAVVEALEPQLGESALDLYCGVGLFAGALAPHLGPGGRVTAIEADPIAVEDAIHNLADLAATVRVRHGRVEHVLKTSGIRRADLVVLDPPRSGAGRLVTEWMCSLSARRIAYVACDPAALARDLATARECGYGLTALRAFDLFPMTHHVECLAVLEPLQA